MLKEAIAQAATVEEAVAAAAAELGVSPEKADYEVLQEPQKKTLGLFGGAPAKVRVFMRDTPAEAAAAYLRSILSAMQVTDVSVAVREEESSCVLTLDGENLGFIIGRRGDTLDALQYLVGLIANRASEDYYRVTIDIGNYREKREQSLVGLAKKIGGQVGRTGRKVSLEAMNPYERRIIHTTIQGMTGVVSWSVGSEPNRHVVIGPSDDNPAKNKPRSGTNKGRPSGKRREEGEQGAGEKNERPPRQQRRAQQPDVAPERPARQIREFVPRSNPLPVADGATPPSKTESEKEESATLYGRIDL